MHLLLSLFVYDNYFVFCLKEVLAALISNGCLLRAHTPVFFLPKTPLSFGAQEDNAATQSVASEIWGQEVVTVGPEAVGLEQGWWSGMASGRPAGLSAEVQGFRVSPFQPLMDLEISVILKNLAIWPGKEVAPNSQRALSRVRGQAINEVATLFVP